MDKTQVNSGEFQSVNRRGLTTRAPNHTDIAIPSKLIKSFAVEKFKQFLLKNFELKTFFYV